MRRAVVTLLLGLAACGEAVNKPQPSALESLGTGPPAPIAEQPAEIVNPRAPGTVGALDRPQALRRFFESLGRLESGQAQDDVRILQFGDSHTKVAVIVGPMAKELYGGYEAAIDKTISLQGIPFTIVGVFVESMDTYGNSEVSEHTLLVPYEVARYFTGTNTLKEIFFSMATAAEVEPASADITSIIQRRHRATSVYKAQTLTDILKTMAKIADMLTLVLVLASTITLIVSGVGIMNSMLANVQSRIREIGIRKALGATSREIRLQFLTESVFLSLAGGIIGTLIGIAIPFSLRFFTDFTIPISPWSAVASLTTSVLVGVIFGTLPANRAAKLDPVTTLKYE